MQVFGPYTGWNANHLNYAGLTVRFVLRYNEILNSVSNLRFLPGYHAITYNIAKCYIGHQASSGDPYDFDGNHVQVFWSGSPSVAVSDAIKLSDSVNINISAGKPVVISIYFTAPSDIPYISGSSGFPAYYKAGDDASTKDASGYANIGFFGTLHVIQELTGTLIFTHYLSGTVKEKGSPVQRTVRSFLRSTGALVDTTQSNPDGTFSVGALDNISDHFVIAFDDEAGDQYNALIYDKVKGVPI